MEAEQALTRVAGETGLQVVILRLPLVYGPGVKANFKNLIKLANSGFPLPLKGINNRRSFLYLGNLSDAINTCLNHPLASGETFMVSDGQDISTPDLIKTIACAMSKKPSLFSLDTRFLRMMCKVIGKGGEVEKLTGTLVVDSTKIRALLGWKPPFSLEEGVRNTVSQLTLC
jgi:nucleoside-diphosphate-sugar epimerase